VTLRARRPAVAPGALATSFGQTRMPSLKSTVLEDLTDGKRACQLARGAKMTVNVVLD
jgi:hypothetical protein